MSGAANRMYRPGRFVHGLKKLCSKGPYDTYLDLKWLATL